MSNLTLTAEQISAFLQQNPEVVSQIFVLADNHQNDDSNSNSNNNDNNVISLQEQQTIYLREKNLQLENKLKELISFGEENDITSSKMHKLNVALNLATTFSGVINTLNFSLKEDFDVDPVSVCFWELPKGISDEKSLPTNCRINAKLKEFATTLKRPYCLSTEGLEISEWFGSNCDENSIKSQAIMAIKNGDEVFGILALGSNNQNRFFPQMGTIYLERMSEMLAASLVRTVFSK